MKNPTFRPDPASARDAVGEVPPWAQAQEDVGRVVDAIAEIETRMASLAAMRAELVNDAFRLSGLAEQLSNTPESRVFEFALRSLRAELAAALRMPESTVEGLVVTSERLLRECPATLEALREGRISYRHAELIADTMSDLPDDAATRAEFDTAAVALGEKLTVPKFRKKVRQLRERMHPQPAEERHRAAIEDRHVRIEPVNDGMAYCTAYLPVADAFAIQHRLTSIAKVAAEDEGELRTRDQLMADVFRDLLIDAPADPGEVENGFDVGRFRGIRPTVFVTVPVQTLLDQPSDEPPVLEGYGPIDVDTARELTANAPSLLRLLTDPHTGARLDLGRDSYRVPRDLRMWLRVRDETCRFPGCNRRAEFCDLDHSQDWAADGETCAENLSHLCRGHHMLKHHSDWRMRHLADGTIVWISPLGIRHITQPAHDLLPRSRPGPGRSAGTDASRQRETGADAEGPAP